MKAVVYTQYGAPKVLQLKEIPKPKPKQNEILVKIKASSASMGDYRIRSLDLPPGFGLIGSLMRFFKPIMPVLGVEFSGIVETIGSKIKKFNVGDEVFGIHGNKMGAYATYKVMPETIAITHKPSSLSFEEAAVMSFGPGTALYFLRRMAKLQKGEKILVNGASGSVGSAAIQLAKHLGAEVTGVCSSNNLELVESLGANHVIDYNKTNFLQQGQKYDVIFDAVGNLTYTKTKHCLSQRGRILLIAGSLGSVFRSFFNKKIIAGPVKENSEDLDWLANLAHQHGFRPLIDKTYSIDNIVEAHTYLDAGRKKGNIVIQVN